MQQTLFAMKRVTEIRDIRQKRFKLARKLLANKTNRSNAIREIKQSIDLIISPIARERQGIDINKITKVKKTVQKNKKMED
jgi:hypothetical protein